MRGAVALGSERQVLAEALAGAAMLPIQFYVHEPARRITPVNSSAVMSSRWSRALAERQRRT